MTGSIGLLGTRPSYEMMMNCDTLLTMDVPGAAEAMARAVRNIGRRAGS